LVELLVVMAIVGVLIALLLPSVQQAREAGRRIQCTNNLRQLAVALQHYESDHRALPAAGKFADPDAALHLTTPSGVVHHWRIDLQSGPHYSWMVPLLPYLEDSALRDQFDDEKPVTRNANDPQANQLASLLCPSDGAVGRYYETVDPTSARMVTFGKANYAAFSSPFHVDSWFYPGAISLYGSQLRHVLSGTSETLVFSEVRTRDHVGDHRGAWALPWSGSTLLSMDVHPANPSGTSGCPPFECQQVFALRDKNRSILSPYVPWQGSVGFSQPPNGYYPDILYDCPEKEAAQLERLPCLAFDGAGYMSAAPRSTHPGGVNAAFLDGHVDFLPDDVDEMVMARLISIDDMPGGVTKE
jgi:prepilin-type processing-associated H-X9-DG protein